MINKIRTKFSESGMVGILLAVAVRLPGVKALCVYYVYGQKISEFNDSSSFENYRVEVLDHESSLEDLTDILDKPEIYRQRFKMHNFCLIAYAGSKAVAYLWGDVGPMHIEQRYGFKVPIAEDQIYIYDGYTHPEWRRKGLLSYLLQKMVFHCETELRKNELISIIEAGNLVSQKANEKMGFSKARLELFIDILGRTRHVRLYSYRPKRR